MELRGVHPKMDAAHAETVSAHRGGQDQQAARRGLIGGSGGFLQPGDQRRQRDQLGRVILGQPVRRAGKIGRRRQVFPEQRLHLAGMGRGRPKLRQDRAGRIDPFELRGIAFQAQRLFTQAEMDAGRPADVGPPVHVVAHPGREAIGQRPEFTPPLGPALDGGREQQVVQAVPRILRAAQGRQDLAMLEVERDRGPFTLGDTDCRFRNRAAAGRIGHGVALRRGQQKGRVRGEDDVEQRMRPTPGEPFIVRAEPRKPGEGGFVVRNPDRLQQAGQAVGAVEQAVALKLGRKPGRVAQRQAARFQIAGQFQAELENRVEQRRFGCALVQNAKAFAKLGAAGHRRAIPFAGDRGKARPFQRS